MIDSGVNGEDVTGADSTGLTDRESGTTLTEVLVVLTITTLLSVPLLTVVRTASRIHQERVAADRAGVELDRVMDLMAEDLRIGAPVDTRPSGTRAENTIGVQLTDPTGAPSVVYWSVGRRGLRRIEVDPSTNRVRSRDVVNPDITEELLGETVAFSYYDASGRELDPLTVGLDRLARCTSLVGVDLTVPVAGREAVPVAGHDAEQRRVRKGSARHAVRTRSPGANRC